MNGTPGGRGPDVGPPSDPSGPPANPGPDEWWGWGPPWARHRAQRRWARRRRRNEWRSRPHGGFFRFFGCLAIAIVLLVGGTTAVATWVAGALLGVIAPEVAPSSFIAIAAILVVALAVLAGLGLIGGAVRPLAELGDATERLADGEPEVRVRPHGPQAVRSLAAAFNAMAERLDRSRDERRALLADVTHELRTPLTVISGELEAMLDGVHPIDAAHITPILAETQVMRRLLDDLRTLSLADAGALTLHREPTDLRSLASEAVAAHRTAATTAGVDLTAAGADVLVTSVDPVRVREIITNLVTNAIRHTPAGGRVVVEIGRDGDDALITVIDTGEGIAPDDLARVFDRFHRRADSGGSGLGLAIVRDLTAAHGGTATVTSDGVAGHGATFLVRLPLRD
jgi:signal transduction histidine kinase